MFGGVRRYFAFTKQQPSPREVSEGEGWGVCGEVSVP